MDSFVTAVLKWQKNSEALFLVSITAHKSHLLLPQKKRTFYKWWRYSYLSQTKDRSFFISFQAGDEELLVLKWSTNRNKFGDSHFTVSKVAHMQYDLMLWYVSSRMSLCHNTKILSPHDIMTVWLSASKIFSLGNIIKVRIPLGSLFGPLSWVLPWTSPQLPWFQQPHAWS